MPAGRTKLGRTTCPMVGVRNLIRRESMKMILVSALALGAMTSVALAAEPTKPTPAQAGPVELTDAQMDGVTAGQVVVNDVVDVGNVAVGIPVNAAANVCAVIAACRAEAQQRPGRIQQ